MEALLVNSFVLKFYISKIEFSGNDFINVNDYNDGKQSYYWD